MDPKPADIQGELVRRQKAAARTVVGLMIAAALLAVIAFLSRGRFDYQPSRGLDIAIRITMLMLGFGLIVLRRTKFQAMRLQDIGALQGASGLLRTLERTTLQLAILAAAIAVIGFAGTWLMGNEYYSYTGSAIAVFLLAYSYPIKDSWVKTLARFADSSSASLT